MNRGFLSLLGVARRAGRLVAGTETVAAAVRRGQAVLMLAAADLAPGTRERLARLASAHRVRLLIGGRRDELSSATGCPGRGVYGVTDRELATAIERLFGDDAVGTAEGGVHHSQQD